MRLILANFIADSLPKTLFLRQYRWARADHARGVQAIEKVTFNHTQMDRLAMESLVMTREQQLQMLKTALYQNRPHLRAKVA